MERDIWDVLSWIGIIILIAYIIAKLTSQINPPEWVDSVPAISIPLMIGAFYQKVMNFADLTNHRANYLKNNLDNLQKRVSKPVK